VPQKLPGMIAQPNGAEITLKAPVEAGAYRLFAYIFDGQGHAAHANIPFYVDTPAENTQAAAGPDARQSQAQH
jgi:hypothetical protein